MSGWREKNKILKALHKKKRCNVMHKVKKYTYVSICLMMLPWKHPIGNNKNKQESSTNNACITYQAPDSQKFLT